MTTVPVNKRKRDWFRILRTLKAHGISMAQIAATTGRQSSAVRNWQNGAEPKESDARIVLALLAKVAPEEYAKQQAEFGIRAAVVEVTAPGEQPRLDFVEVR